MTLFSDPTAVALKLTVQENYLGSCLNVGSEAPPTEIQSELGPQNHVPGGP